MTCNNGRCVSHGCDGKSPECSEYEGGESEGEMSDKSDTPRTDVKCVNCGYPPSRHSPKDSACPCYDMMESYFHPTYKWKSEGKPTSEMDERDERISTLERELAAKAEECEKLRKAIRIATDRIEGCGGVLAALREAPMTDEEIIAGLHANLQEAK